jgi:Rrf2 family protein
MQVPARVHYAALAMMELASTANRVHPLAIREITQRHGIPQPFLVQILQQLKTAGWVTSTRGSQGGYRLSVSAQEVTLLDIAEAVGCQESGCSAESTTNAASRQLMRVWDQADEAYREVLASVTIADLQQRYEKADCAMFYI